MATQTLIYIFVGLSFALYIGIAIASRAGSTSEFYVAGGGVNPVVNGMATAADWMSAASFISMAGIIAFSGYDGSVYLMGWTGGYVMLALLLAPYLRKFGQYTVPDFIGTRYYSRTARVVAVICLIFISFTYIAGQMRGVGIVFSRFLDVPINLGVIIGMGIVFIYAVLGGMKGITYTQVAQYCVLIFAYTVPAIFISLQLTNNPIPQLGLGDQMADGSGLLLQRLDQVLVDLGFAQYTLQKGSTLNLVLLTLSLMIGTAGLPHVIMRFFTVPKVRDARSSAGWALLFVAALYTAAPAVGGMAMFNLIDTVQPGEVGSAEGSLAYEQRPQWFKTWETTGLLEFEDHNNDGRVQFYNDKNADFDAPADWSGNELTVDRDIMVLANPEIAGLPAWVIALIAAGGLAAALSTAAGLLLAISSAISHDLLKGLLMPDLSDKAELRAGRIAMAAAILLAGYLGMNPPGFAAQVVALAFGLAASSLFPAIFLGIFFKRINKEGAICGMLIGLLSTLLYIFWFKGWFFIPGTAMVPNTIEHLLFGIQPEAFGAVGALLNFVTAFAVSAMTKQPPEAVMAMVDRIRLPVDELSERAASAKS